jgi:hypothetical protein
MQLTRLNAVRFRQERIGRWVRATSNHNPELAALASRAYPDVNATSAVSAAANLGAAGNSVSEPNLKFAFLEPNDATIDQSAILEYQRPEAALMKPRELHKRNCH